MLFPNVFFEKDGSATKDVRNYVGVHQVVNDGMVISAAQHRLIRTCTRHDCI